MKRCIFVLSNIFFLLISCEEKRVQINETSLEEDNDRKQTIIESEGINTTIDLYRNETMYVNSPEGLRVRDKPNLDGEKLFLLEKNHEVTVLQKDVNDINIDGIIGNWVYIKSNVNESQGWVFGGYLSKEKTPGINDFRKYITLNNCTLTDAYSVPNINNYLIGLPDDPPNPIEKNSIDWRYGGIQICLKNDISPENDIVLTMKNDIYEFSKKLKLFPVHNENGISGYYENIDLEIKPWTATSKGDEWQLIINEGQNELINETRKLSYIISLIFDTVDDSPFITNNLKYVKLYKKYTYRFLNEFADILILYYYSPDYRVYKPILYLIPNKDNLKSYTDIEISWNDEIVKGIYHIGKYKLNDLPTEEETTAIFDFIGVQ
ncbi:MAG: SH3 domain-containing protein [Treponema sp.]|jgi:hypothetical protein|nr:SH3 domain-containing protein [Treponema sp.]